MKLQQAKSVYIIYNPEFNITKIGISFNAKDRMSSIMSHSGCQVELRYRTKDYTNAEMIERTMHEHFKANRKLFEWFYGDPQVMIDKLKEYEQEFGVTDRIAERYCNGETIKKLAGDNNVSRQAIIKRLKRSGLHLEKKVLAHIPLNEVLPTFCIQDFKKIQENIYFNTKQYKLKIYSGGTFIEKYYEQLDHAITARDQYKRRKP